MLPIAGQTAGPNGLKFFCGHSWMARVFFQIFFITFFSNFFFRGQRWALQLFWNIVTLCGKIFSGYRKFPLHIVMTSTFFRLFMIEYGITKVVMQFLNNFLEMTIIIFKEKISKCLELIFIQNEMAYIYNG